MIAEVPGAILIPAHPTCYHARPIDALVPYSLIVEHITSGRARARPVAEMWQCPKGSKENPHGTSAHFVIDQDGGIIQCVRLRLAANHAHAANAYSVGIEHCAREPGEFGPDDPGLPPSPIQLERSAWLTAYLLKAAGLAPQRGLNVMGHAEADPATSHTGCPDAAPWPWESYMQHTRAAWDAIGSAPLIV